MQKKLVWRDYLYVGSMLFGLFFGAGNLIFPVHRGQEAGASVFLANLGFLATGIGLIFLGVIAMGVSKVQVFFDLASRINRRYALIFYLTIIFNDWSFLCFLPRLATTSFEIGLAPFVPKDLQWLVLAGFFRIIFSFSCLALSLESQVKS